MHIPFSGRNPAFQETLDVKPHVLIFNKMDLADLSHKQVKLPTAVVGQSQLDKHLKYELYISSTGNPEEVRKERSGECSLHRLFKAAR